MENNKIMIYNNRKSEKESQQEESNLGKSSERDKYNQLLNKIILIIFNIIITIH